MDGVAKEALNLARCGGIFRDYRCSFMGAFSLHIGLETLFRTMLSFLLSWETIEIMFNKGWRNLWLESDSSLVTVPFKKFLLFLGSYKISG